VAALTLVAPPLVFAALAIAVERRTGRRWLALFALATLGAYLAFLAWRLSSNPAVAGRLVPIGGLRGFVAAGLIFYGVQFAFITAAVAWLGAHRARPRRLWLQGLGAVAALLIGTPIAILLSAATLSIWSG
jgi:hypothetical protein